MNWTVIITTAIICSALVALCAMSGKDKGGKR